MRALIILVLVFSFSYAKSSNIAVNNSIAKWKFITKFRGTPIKWMNEYHCIKYPKLYFSVYHQWNKNCKLAWKKQGYSKGSWKEICTNDDGKKFYVYGYISYHVNKVVITKRYKIVHQPFKEVVVAKFLRKCTTKEIKKLNSKKYKSSFGY